MIDATFPGSVAFVTKYWEGPIEVPLATGLVDRSTFRMEGRDLLDPSPGFRYGVWIRVEDQPGELTYERLGSLEPIDGVWVLERAFEPPRFVYSAVVTLEPTGIESMRWTAFYPPSGVYDGEPGTYQLAASEAYSEPAANLSVRAGPEAWFAHLRTSGFEPGHCYDFDLDQLPCFKPPQGVQFCVWASGMPASATALQLLGCYERYYEAAENKLGGREALGEVRIVVSMHSTNETAISAPSQLRPIDQILCLGHEACTRPA